MNWKTWLIYVSLFCLGLLAGFIFPLNANAWVAHVEYTVSTDPTDKTVVLVSETSGDYGSSYGQISEPGADSVDIGNIKPSTTYYFVAYRLASNGQRSLYSEEVEYTTSATEDPVVYPLPSIVLEGVVLNIQIIVETP